MTALAKSAAMLALAATILPPVLFMADQMTLDVMKLWMLLATIAWFVTAPMVMRS